MTGTPTDDQPGIVAEEPEHCHDCYRLIRPGQTYFLTIEQAVVCPDCVRTADAVRLSGGLTVEVGEDRLLVRHESAAVEVLPHEVRHLAYALVEGAARLTIALTPQDGQRGQLQHGLRHRHDRRACQLRPPIAKNLG